jgi:hypothetical protein
MLFRLLNRVGCILLLALILALASCSGGGGGGDDDESADDGEPVSSATATVISETMVDVQNALNQAMGQVETAASDSRLSQNTHPRQSDMSVSCQEGGNVSLSLSASRNGSTITFDASLTFNACDEINGTLTFTGNGTITEEQFDFVLTLNGAITTPTCSLTMTAFRQTVSMGETQEFTMTIDGSIQGSCEEENFRCTFDDHDVDLSDPNAESDVFNQSCQLT